jgi:outer membrane protein TolC
LQRPTLALAAPLKLPSNLPAELVGQRPDVVASRWQVAAQARGIDVAHAGFFPNVDLVGSLGFMATGGGPLEFLTGASSTTTSARRSACRSSTVGACARSWAWPRPGMTSPWRATTRPWSMR